MKVLFIVNSCCTPITSSKRFYTGYDYIVSDIADRLSSCCELEIYSLNPCAEDCRIGNVLVKSCVEYKKLLKYIRLKDVLKYIKIFNRSLPYVRSAIKNLLWYLAVDDIEKLIKVNDYDIIHIHGVTFGCYIASLASARNKKAFLFTMHGLISYGVPGISIIDTCSEQAALSVIKDNEFIATTVSSGTKRIPCEDRGIASHKIEVINNAIKKIEVSNPDYWCLKYPQIKGKKIIISVGTICTRKNQSQIIKVFTLLPKEVQESVVVMLAGEDRTEGEMEKLISEYELQNSVFICGFVSKEKLSNLYAIADYNAMLSISEGFGLSMIEAASYGIPSLTFSDLDAIKDIYSPNSMLTMDDRSDETVAAGIQKMLATKWDKEQIIKESQKFNEDLYLQYLDVYNKIIDSGSNIVDPKAITVAIGL